MSRPAVVGLAELQARNVLSMAFSGGMPDTFWHTDRRIASACQVLGWTVEFAREWAEENAPRRG